MGNPYGEDVIRVRSCRKASLENFQQNCITLRPKKKKKKEAIDEGMKKKRSAVEHVQNLCRRWSKNLDACQLTRSEKPTKRQLTFVFLNVSKKVFRKIHFFILNTPW